MKKWSIIAALVITFLIEATMPTSALAQSSEDADTGSDLVFRDSLAIVAPRITAVDTEISMTVFRCSDQDPVEGANVWLISRERLEIVKQEISVLRGGNSLNNNQQDYESLLSMHGTRLGETNADGKLYHTFDSRGQYLFVAAMSRYFPDARSIAVGMIPRALAIDAPRRAPVGEDVTITVFQRGTQDPVKDAGVWAFTREDAESLKTDMGVIRESGDQEAVSAAVEEACDIHGIFLGTTNGAGKVKHAFEEAGGYLLVAIKGGYFPGWRIIVITPGSDTPIMVRPDASSENLGTISNIL